MNEELKALLDARDKDSYSCSLLIRDIRALLAAQQSEAPAVPDETRLLEVWAWCRQSGADFMSGNSVNRAKHTVFMSVADHIKHKYFGACRDTKMLNMLAASRKDANG